MGCSVEATGSGKLAYRFRWTGADGARRRFCVTTDLADNTANRDALERKRTTIGREIRAGTFDPMRHFRNVRWPFGLGPSRAAEGMSIVERMPEWIRACDRPGVRASRIRDYRSHHRNYFKAHPIGDRDPMRLSKIDLEGFQRWLVTPASAGGAGVSEKTAANVLRGTLGAFLRDIGAPTGTLEALRWERYAPTRRQSPFEPAERDAILAWFRSRYFPEYVSLRIRFRGISPSETRGLQVGDFGRATGTLRIERSVHLGKVGATKTDARERVVELDGDTAAAVATLAGMRPPEAFLLDVAEDTLRDHFRRCLTALGFAQRSLYQAKHTCAVTRLLAGESPADVASDMGISLATLEKHYAWAYRRARRLAENRPKGTASA